MAVPVGAIIYQVDLYVRAGQSGALTPLTPPTTNIDPYMTGTNNQNYVTQFGTVPGIPNFSPTVGYWVYSQSWKLTSPGLAQFVVGPTFPANIIAHVGYNVADTPGTGATVTLGLVDCVLVFRVYLPNPAVPNVRQHRLRR